MNSENLRLLFIFADIAAPLIVGYWLKKRRILTRGANDRLIKFNIRVVNTLLALLSFWVLPFNVHLLFAPLFDLYIVLVPCAIGYLFFARRIKNVLDRGAYIVSAMLSNVGTLGGICAFILYHEEGFAYAQLVATFQNLLICLIVFPLAQYYHLKAGGTLQRTGRLRSFIEMFISPNQLCLVGMALGILLNAGGVARPAPLGSMFQSLVHIGAWTAMLPVGFLVELRAVRENLPKTNSLTILRFVVMPILTYFFVDALVVDSVFRGTLLILACCPTAVLAVTTVRIYQLNVDLATTSFLVTTALFIFPVFPLLFFLLRR